jgi:hypothetical protein
MLEQVLWQRVLGRNQGPTSFAYCDTTIPFRGWVARKQSSEKLDTRFPNRDGDKVALRCRRLKENKGLVN